MKEAGSRLWMLVPIFLTLVWVCVCASVAYRVTH